MNSGFEKRVYNDIDGDVVNFFKCLQDDEDRRQLLRMLRSTPMSRKIFKELHSEYVKREMSFEGMPRVERAWALFYRSSFAFGGKIRNGGFGASLSDRYGTKEIKRYYGILKDFARLGQFWKGTVIESMHYEDLIVGYKRRPGLVFYADPPYVGTEDYYSRKFGRHEHFTLATALTESDRAAVVSYYDCPEVREYYPESNGWTYTSVAATRNSLGRNKTKNSKVEELLIVKQERKNGI